MNNISVLIALLILLTGCKELKDAENNDVRSKQMEEIASKNDALGAENRRLSLINDLMRVGMTKNEADAFAEHSVTDGYARKHTLDLARAKMIKDGHEKRLENAALK